MPDEHTERTYRCAICDREVRYRTLPSVYPFCSARCKRVDLGMWFREQHSIDRDLTPEDRPETGEQAG